MTKQEKIREGKYYVPQSNQPKVQEKIAEWLHGASTNPWKELNWEEIPDWRKDQYRKNAYFLMVTLDDLGLVIKVERESPEVQYTLEGSVSPSAAERIADAYHKAYAGYVAVESLIEREK